MGEVQREYKDTIQSSKPSEGTKPDHRDQTVTTLVTMASEEKTVRDRLKYLARGVSKYKNGIKTAFYKGRKEVDQESSPTQIKDTNDQTRTLEEDSSGTPTIESSQPTGFSTTVEMMGPLLEFDDYSEVVQAELTQRILGSEQVFKDELRSGDVGSVMLRMDSLLKHPGPLRDFANNFVRQHLTEIDAAVAAADDTTEAWATLNAAAKMVDIAEGSSSDDGALVVLIDKHFDKSTSYAKSTFDGMPSLIARTYIDQSLPLFIKGNQEQRYHARDTILDLFDGNEDEQETGAQVINDLLTNNLGIRPDDARVQQYGEALACIHMQDLGLDYDDFLYKWRLSNTDAEPNEVYARNFATLAKLESQRPGIAKVLHDEFGVSDFARYPERMLVEQYDQRDNIDIPYGVMLYPTIDEVGAFYNPFAYDNLPDQLNSEYTFRAYEVNNLRELVSAVNKARHKYGPIDTVIIGGHGRPEGIQLGLNDSATAFNELTTADVNRSGARALQKAFVEHPTIVLASCSTGELGGIGQQISALGSEGARVIAPKIPTQLEKVNAVKDASGRFRFDVKFVAEDSKAKYTMGQAS